MQFTIIAFQYHEADRVSVFKNLLKAKNLGVKIMRLAHVADWKCSGNSSKMNNVTGDIVHRKAFDCKGAATLHTVMVDMARFVV